MARQLTAAQPARARTTHWMTEALVVAMAMSAAVVVAWAITGVGAHSRARTDSGAATAWSRLSDIPSHNATYQASLIASRERGDLLDQWPGPWLSGPRRACRSKVLRSDSKVGCPTTREECSRTRG